MSATGKDLEERKKPGEALTQEALTLPQAAVEVHAAGMHLKTKTKKSEQQPAATREHAKDVLYQGMKTCWVSNMGNTVEAKDSFPPWGVNVVQGSKWRTRQATEWDDPVEWKLLVITPSLSMEQLREKFRGMEIHAVVTLEATGATTGSGTTKTTATLATPSPSLLQLQIQMPIPTAGVSAQTTVTANLATPLPLQLAALVSASTATARGPAPVPMTVAGILLQGVVLVWEERQPPPFVAHFDGCPGCLAHFLAQAWHRMECYGVMYLQDAARVHIRAVNLNKSALEWLVSLHYKDAPELVNLNAFMQALQERFKDPEAHIHSLKQGK